MNSVSAPEIVSDWPAVMIGSGSSILDIFGGLFGGGYPLTITPHPLQLVVVVAASSVSAVRNMMPFP